MKNIIKIQITPSNTQPTGGNGQQKLQRRNGDHGPKAGNSEHRQRSRPPLERMLKIYGLLQDAKRPNCSTMAAQFEVSAETVKRDIGFMRDRYALPIEYDAKGHGFYFSKPVDRFPGIPVTEKELFAVCVANKVVDQYRGTSFQQPLELAFEKLSGQLDHEQRFTLQNLDEALSFRPFAPEDADLQLFEQITEAIRERRTLAFQYRKPGVRIPAGRRVNPYHLMQCNNRWYLLAHDLERGEIRKFVLGRMREMKMTAEHFEFPADFDPKKFMERSLGVMAGTGDFEVVIEADAWLTDVLRGRRWHPSQVWTELPGGGSHLRLRLSGLDEIEQWVLSWGTRATVIRPQALADRVARTARALAARYADDLPAPEDTAGNSAIHLN